jgi:hypothetical protein
MAVELGRGRRRSLYSSYGARGVKVGGFKGEVNSRRRPKGADSWSKRAHIHGSKSASLLRFADVLSTHVIGHARKAMYARIRRTSGSKMYMIKVRYFVACQFLYNSSYRKGKQFWFFSFELMPILNFKQILQIY